jgi:ubiquinone/menaquinone biosynthesis C-methylase UbiE
MAEKDDKYDWTSIDRAVEPDHFVDYLDTANSIQHFQSYKRKTYASMKVEQGHCVLDVGCGAGEDVLALAQIVGDTGRVVGIDNSETMIAEARKRAEGFGGRVEFRLGDAHNLDFADNIFDGCRADRVFQHLEEPKQALSEMIRGSGGRC